MTVTMTSVAEQFAEWKTIADAAEQRKDTTTLLAMHVDMTSLSNVLSELYSSAALSIARDAVDALDDDVLALRDHIDAALARIGRPGWQAQPENPPTEPPAATAAQAYGIACLAKVQATLDAMQKELIADLVSTTRRTMTTEPRQ